MTAATIHARFGRALFFAVLAGCGQEVRPIKGPDPIEIQIAEAMSATAEANAKVAEIEKNLSQLHAVRTTPTATNSVPDSGTIQPELSASVVEVDWNGPVEPLLHSLARITGYSVVIAGKAPVNPVHVAIAGFNGHPLDAVGKIDDSVFGAARVSFETAGKTIALTYAD